ncbi:IS21 family transposase, partial [Acinetobacter baumannii]
MDQIGWIRRLKGREGKSERESARMTGLSRNTVAKWLRADVQPPKDRRPAVSCKLTPF